MRAVPRRASRASARSGGNPRLASPMEAWAPSCLHKNRCADRYLQRPGRRCFQSCRGPHPVQLRHYRLRPTHHAAGQSRHRRHHEAVAAEPTFAGKSEPRSASCRRFLQPKFGARERLSAVGAVAAERSEQPDRAVMGRRHGCSEDEKRWLVAARAAAFSAPNSAPSTAARWPLRPARQRPATCEMAGRTAGRRHCRRLATDAI
jgi:hypothetical protein